VNDKKDPLAGAVGVAVDAASQAMHFAAQGLRMIGREASASGASAATEPDFTFERKLVAALEQQQVAYQADIAALRQVVTGLEADLAALQTKVKKQRQELKKLKGNADD